MIKLLRTSPKPIYFSGCKTKISTELQFSLSQPLQLSLGGNILSQQLQLINLQLRHLLQKSTKVLFLSWIFKQCQIGWVEISPTLKVSHFMVSMRYCFIISQINQNLGSDTFSNFGFWTNHSPAQILKGES